MTESNLEWARARRIGELERQNQDLIGVIHRIKNMHACISCIYDAMDDAKMLARTAIERWEDDV